MDVTLARIIHVISVVLWIGGVGFVTTVVFPSVRRAQPPEQRLAAFARFERPFAWQARINIALAGGTGLYMTARLHAWDRFAAPAFWWMDAMAALWLVFAAMLFVIEPLVLHRRMARVASGAAAAQIFARMERFHRVMLGASLMTIVGAVGGSHGLFS
jgi:uncharacterized membrane protein